MFNSLRRDFDEDPFFSDPFGAHNERVRGMMRSFSEPFGRGLEEGRGPEPRLEEGRGHRHSQGGPSSSLALRQDHMGMDLFRSPFHMMDNMMAGMRNRMDNMHRNMESLSTEPSSHSYSSSSVMTYSKVGEEPAKVFQAASQTRSAPGGVKETRRSLKDSESGVQKMAIGHHIHDRGHVIERKHNTHTGERELNQDFQNMDETEAQTFDEEWQREVSRFCPPAPLSRLQAPPPRAARRAAIAAPPDPRRGKLKAEERREPQEP
ncbi:myeloid leukemia factor 1 [Conger conger]|uniref:myeloid leukemia factor 1 n=1 Tax=Conger conger TaxID=82655 RepID=UPI002A5AB0FD|nr:myeloid leukemia factor 1 [Conger conger]